jgi:hypothetical protein
MRADCAPRSTSGDGRITATDWTQAGRYAAAIDSWQPANGPFESVSQFLGSPLPRTKDGSGGRVVSAGPTNVAAGANVTVPFALAALGDENTLGFSVVFDPAVLSYQSVAKGSALPAGAQMIVNTNQVAQGRLGILLGLASGETFPAATQQIARVMFQASASVALASTEIGFGDSPVVREVGSAQAEVLPADYVGATVAFAVLRLAIECGPQNAVRVTLHGCQNRDYVVEISHDLRKPWLELTNGHATEASVLINDPGSVTNTVRFYRAYQP